MQTQRAGWQQCKPSSGGMVTAQEESFPRPPACLKSVGFEDKTASEGIPVGYSDLINGETFSLVFVSVKKGNEKAADGYKIG